MDLDITLFFQLGLLLAMSWLLKGLLFNPILQLLEKRQHSFYGLKHEALAILRKVTSESQSYESKLSEAQAAARKEREKMRQEGKLAAHRIMTDARKSVAESLRQMRVQLGQAEGDLQRSLTSDLDTVTSNLFKKLVGRELQ